MVEEKEEMLRKVKASVGSSQKLISAKNACVSYQFIASHLHVPLSMPCTVILKLNPLTISSLSIEGALEEEENSPGSAVLAPACSCGGWTPAVLTTCKFQWHHWGTSRWVLLPLEAAGSLPVNSSGTPTSTFLVMLSESC